MNILYRNNCCSYIYLFIGRRSDTATLFFNKTIMETKYEIVPYGMYLPINFLQYYHLLVTIEYYNFVNNIIKNII